MSAFQVYSNTRSEKKQSALHVSEQSAKKETRGQTSPSAMPKTKNKKHAKKAISSHTGVEEDKEELGAGSTLLGFSKTKPRKRGLSSSNLKIETGKFVDDVHVNDESITDKDVKSLSKESHPKKQKLHCDMTPAGTKSTPVRHMDIANGKKGLKTRRSRGCDSSEEDVINEPGRDDKYISSSHLRSFKIKEKTIIFLEEKDKFPVVGRCTVQCIAGAVKVLGYILRPDHLPQDLFCPTSNSLLCVECFSPERDVKVVKAACKQLVHSADPDVDVYDELPSVNGGVSVVVLSPLISLLYEYIETIPPFLSLFMENGKCHDNTGDGDRQIQCCPGFFLPHDSGQYPVVEVSEDYDFVLDKWTTHFLKDPTCKSPVLVTSGGKDSGKSTLNRFLINASLNVVSCVYVLDCDVGQTEFSPPGCISLTAVKQPVFGPPFTHQRDSEMCLCFGSVNSADNPNMYMTCLKQCVHHYHTINKGEPLIVNTMGWVRGLGLKLLISTLKLVGPDVVVQLDSRKGHSNAPSLTPSYVASADDWKVNRNDTDPESMSEYKEHSLIVISSPVTGVANINGSRKLKPGDHRDLCVLSSLCWSFGPGETIHSQTPYSVRWCDVAIHVLHQTVPDFQLMNVINGCVVALCTADHRDTFRSSAEHPLQFRKCPLFTHVGIGLVRSIDTEQKQILIVTSVPAECLQSVNTIVRGTLSLPESIFLGQNFSEAPFVDTTIGTIGSSSLRQRQHLPRSQKGFNKN